MTTYTVVVLNSGLRVANFSSPHPFNFATGEVLAACSPERANAMALTQVEVEQPGIAGTRDIALQFVLSDVVRAALEEVQADDEVDVVLVPFPVLAAVKEAGLPIGKARVCRTADRVTKTVHGDKFCV